MQGTPAEPKARNTMLLAVAFLAVVVMMVLPVPSWVVDVGLAASFALAILIFAVTLFIQTPLDFSSFPTVLLGSLMLRLALNVSSTKLIIGQGHTGTAAAGEVIEGFAMFVMSGSVLIGLVVFGVLMIVNFIVITKGAGRMAEVGARFALDGMPGRQMAIDADMNAGAIDHDEARRRREREQAETTFFGSLDGASKFVKGDAVAGLMITLLNLVVGMGIGVGAHGMPFAQALETYAILTVGDGLVGQIPAVIISISAALLLARGGTRGAADRALLEQLGKHPAAIATVAGLMALFAIVPGLPFIPFLTGAIALGGAAHALGRSDAARKKQSLSQAQAQRAEPARPDRSLGDMLDVDEIHLEFAPDLVGMVLDPATGLEPRIGNMRNHVARSFGLILPEIRLTDDPALSAGCYRIRIQGVPVAQDRLVPAQVLALTGDSPENLVEGTDVREPVYGAAARWIAADQRETAVMAGLTVVGPTEVLATHLLEVVKANFSRLLTLKTLRRLLEESANLSSPARAEANRRLFDELIPEKVPVDLLLAVLRLLLEERVSIRNLPMILEAIAETRGAGGPEAVCEHVRRRLGFQLIAELRRADGTVPLVQLAPEWERIFVTHEAGDGPAAPDVALPSDIFARLTGNIADALARAAESGTFAAIVTSSRRRRFLRTIMGARGLTAPVLSYDEVGTSARPALVGVVPS